MWVGGDLSSSKEQVEQADPKFGAKTVLQMVIKSLFWLFTKKQKRFSILPAAFLTIPFLFLYKTAPIIAGQFSVEFSRLGEWCRMFQSLQLHRTA